MKEPILTSDLYVKASGQVCPFCKSPHISGSAIQAEGTEAWQDVTCDDCHHAWQDTFQLVGYTTEFSEQPEEGGGPLPDNVKVGATYLFAYPEQFVTKPEYDKYRGQRVTVLRQLTEEEADQGDGMERMFEIQASDGWIGQAWASELLGDES